MGHDEVERRRSTWLWIYLQFQGGRVNGVVREHVTVTVTVVRVPCVKSNQASLLRGAACSWDRQRYMYAPDCKNTRQINILKNSFFKKNL